MIRKIFLCLLLAAPSIVVTSAAFSNEAVAAAPWYLGKWKSTPTPGIDIVLELKPDGNGSMTIQKNGNMMGGGKMKYKKKDSQLIVTRNGVDAKFGLDEKRKIVKTADGKDMKRVK